MSLRAPAVAGLYDTTIGQTATTRPLSALSPVAWVALIAVAPLTVVLVRQIQAACVDHFANRQPPGASTE
ncbi:hypothetical protein [Rhodococcus sp. 1168]|uniref:hypothetical protein n=1 Tax=Rhodococcus sp. 1168 TaxID=2018041 RepID=UPI000A0D94EF|nr:hypothetical protein [Rhodococcus sp. 1168]ORI16254.1 hypothetical protein BJI47_14720 [Rhodococcus sp. 1168]